MRLASLKSGRDGKLVVVSPDCSLYAEAPVTTLQEALENWDAIAPQLVAITHFDQSLNHAAITAPLPRAWQWLDGSAFACQLSKASMSALVTVSSSSWRNRFSNRIFNENGSLATLY